MEADGKPCSSNPIIESQTGKRFTIRVQAPRSKHEPFGAKPYVDGAKMTGATLTKR
jgi:hypothetical protein